MTKKNNFEFYKNAEFFIFKLAQNILPKKYFSNVIKNAFH